MDEIIMISTREKENIQCHERSQGWNKSRKSQRRVSAGLNIALGRTGRKGIKSSSSRGWGHHNKNIVVNPYVVTGAIESLAHDIHPKRFR
jgi:hypothetical protein